MKAITTCAVMGALLSTAVGARLSAESRVTLTVRVYNTSRVPAPELLAARRALESAYQDTGLEVTVRPCGRSLSSEGPVVDPCGESLKPLEVVVRVIDAPAFNPNLHLEACGVAYIVRETGRGWLATVFSDRIGEAATRVGLEPGTLLGLVMAHEVAHLLLGIGYHGETGIMRADWPDRLFNHTAGQWRFSAFEAERLRQAASNPVLNRFESFSRLHRQTRSYVLHRHASIAPARMTSTRDARVPVQKNPSFVKTHRSPLNKNVQSLSDREESAIGLIPTRLLRQSAHFTPRRDSSSWRHAACSLA